MPANEWIGIVHSTRPKYMKGASDQTIRSRLLLSLLRKMGRIVYNEGGDECRWQVEFSQPDVEAIGDGGVIDFSNHDAFRQLSHDWRGYVATDTLSKKQNAMNSGDEALIRLFSTKMDRIVKALKDNYCGELFKDGEAPGRENNIHGLDTFTASGTTVAADIIAEPSDTYGLGALSTILGNQGGSWTSDLSTSPNANVATDWPYGQGDSEYDFLSPKLPNWSSSNWGTAVQTWEGNCWRVISNTITWLTTTGGPDGMPTICLMAPNLWQGYKNHEETNRRINIPHQMSQDLGFSGNTLNQDGCALSPDFDVPTNTFYMANLNHVTVKSMFPELFWMEDITKDPRTAWSWLFGAGHYGNVTFNPKHTAKGFNYAA